MSEWRRAKYAVDYGDEEYYECVMAFACKCGKAEIHLDAQNGETKCPVCGRQYRLVAYVETVDPGVHA